MLERLWPRLLPRQQAPAVARRVDRGSEQVVRGRAFRAQ
jgi:hypothetical protein